MDSIPLEELKQIHEYVRQILSVYVAWFTFFLVLLLGAMGWAAKVSFDKSGRFSRPLPFFLMLVLFSVQLIFSIWATDIIRDDFVQLDGRSAFLITALADAAPTKGYTPLSPFPSSLHLAMRLMHYTLVSNLVFWVGVGALLFFTRAQPVMGSADEG
jgi:hypothetical protein